jgi:hypothetical protein
MQQCVKGELLHVPKYIYFENTPDSEPASSVITGFVSR